jgi:hypothetical protein
VTVVPLTLASVVTNTKDPKSNWLTKLLSRNILSESRAWTRARLCHVTSEKCCINLTSYESS